MGDPDDASTPVEDERLHPGKRLALSALAWSALAAASPGGLLRDGLWPLALFGVAIWGVTVRRPGRFAFWIDGLTGGLGWAYLVLWAGYVHWFGLVWMGIGYAIWQGCTGVLMRRMPRMPLALLVPAIWVGVETLRTITPTPFGLSWMRLGVYVHDLEPLNGAARLFGTGGLSWVVAAVAGLAGDLVRRRWVPVGLGSALAWGLGPLILALGVALALPAPATKPGPHVLVTQPAIPQKRKGSIDRRQMFLESLELTKSGLDAEAAAGRDVDLAIWGETMFLVAYYLEDSVVEAYRAGARAQEYWRLEEHHLLRFQRDLSDALACFFDRSRIGILPEGTSFLTGIEVWDEHEGRLARENAGVLFDSDGRAIGRGAKTNLVPGAEDFLGLERFQFARDIILEIGGYIPDLVPAPEPAVLALPVGTDETYRFGLSICFDNAFDRPYLGPAERGADFHVVLSNEGWFESSLELDQMVAFSRLAAIATGRAMVRATNTGISCVLGGDGREIARLVVDGEDREVPGTLAATVPVPADGDHRTPYVRSSLFWTLLWLGLPGLVALGGRARSRRVRAVKA